MITSDLPWDPASTNNKLEVKLIFLGDDEVDDFLYECLHQINAADMNMDQNYSYREQIRW